MATTVGDTRFEALFTSWRLKFKLVEDMPLSDMHVEPDAQVRKIAQISQPPDPAVVQQYATQMRGGAVFPPVVLWAPRLLIDGNTRVTAAREVGRTDFPAYVMELPDVRMAKRLAAALNQLGGVRLTAEEARTEAMEMLDDGLEDAIVARTLGFAAESVRRWRRDQEFVDRVDRLDLTEPASALTKTQRIKVAGISLDPAFTEVVKLVADARPQPQDLKELLDNVSSASSEADMLAVITEARQDWTPIGPEPGRVERNRVAQQARMNLGALLKLDPVGLYDPAHAENDVPRWRQVIELAEQVLGLYGMNAKDDVA